MKYCMRKAQQLEDGMDGDRVKQVMNGKKCGKAST